MSDNYINADICVIGADNGLSHLRIMVFIASSENNVI